MSTENTPVTLRAKAGIILFVVSSPILTETYWRGNGELPLVGAVAVWVVALLAAIGGGAGFWLVAEKPETRRIGLLTGALAGAGGMLAFHLVYGSNNRAGSERILVGLLGMAPGLGLGLWLARRFERKAGKS
jgi:hypothetical protein